MSLDLLWMAAATMARQVEHYRAARAASMRTRPVCDAIRPNGATACAIVRTTCAIV